MCCFNVGNAGDGVMVRVVLVFTLFQALRLEFSRFCAEDFTPQLMRKHRLNDIFQQIQVLFAIYLQSQNVNFGDLWQYSLQARYLINEHTVPYIDTLLHQKVSKHIYIKIYKHS